jgi:hypothetical protein
MRDDVRMRDFVRAEVELILMERSLGWGRLVVLLATLVPILSLFDDRSLGVVLAGTVNALVQWALYLKRRRTYEEALEERDAKFGERDRLIGTMTSRPAAFFAAVPHPPATAPSSRP